MAMAIQLLTNIKATVTSRTVAFFVLKNFLFGARAGARAGK